MVSGRCEEVVVPLLLELIDELLCAQARARLQPRAEKEQLVAVTGEEVMDCPWRRVVVIGSSEAVFENDDGLVGRENAGRSTEHSELGAFDVEFDQPRRLGRSDEIIEPGGLDVDQFDFFVRAVERTLSDSAVTGIGGDMVELQRPGRLLDERDLAHVDRREVRAEIGGQVGEWLDGEVADRGGGGHHVLQHLAHVSADVDRHVVRPEDALDRSHREHVVVPVGARVVPEVDEQLVLVFFGGVRCRFTSALCGDGPAVLDHSLGRVFGRFGRLEQVQSNQELAKRTSGARTHELGGYLASVPTMSDDGSNTEAVESPDAASVIAAAALIAEAERVVVLTGAGISTDSEIPDFRGPQGVWTKNPAAEKMATLQHYVEDVEVRKRAWKSRRSSPVWYAKPNLGHEALLRLEELDKLELLITQNIDGLHAAAGSDPDRIVEVHGSIRDVVCLSCTFRAPMEHALDRVDAGEEDPSCIECGGILKSSTISFGQSLIVEDLQRSEAAAHACDLILAIGSTLSVYPIANVVPVAKSTGAHVVIVNGSETEMDHLADVVVRGSISQVVPQILG